MSNMMPINLATAGQMGSPYVTKITSSSVAVGTYAFTEVNFPGITSYIPGWALVVGVASSSLYTQISTDNGTSYSVVDQGGGWVFMDSASTIRLQVTATANIFIYPMAR